MPVYVQVDGAIAELGFELLVLALKQQLHFILCELAELLIVVGHVQGWDSLECSLAFRGLLSARSIESNGRADERLERIRVNLLTLVNVDGAPCVLVKARVEELGRIFQGSALKEGQLHYRLVRLSRADAPVMGPYRGPHPLPLFHNIRVGLPDEGAHPC